MKKLISTILAFLLLAIVLAIVSDYAAAKEDVFRLEVHTKYFEDSFLCDGFALKWKGEVFGATSGQCDRGGFTVIVLFWKDWIDVFDVSISDGPGRDIALFRKRYLNEYFRVWDVGRSRVGDSVSVVGFGSRGFVTTRCTVDSESNQPGRFYKTVRCDYPLHGMIGSPVIKNGRVVGVLTHLFRRSYDRAVFTSLPEAFRFLGR